VHEIEACEGRRQGGQEEDGDGAYQHHLKFNLGKIDDDARDVAADVRGDMDGAC
jgi:hypothetical protein